MENRLSLVKCSQFSGIPIRSLSVKASGLFPTDEMDQMSLFPDLQREQRRVDIYRTVDKIRAKYGYFSIRRAVTLVDPALDLDARGEPVIHPVGFLGTLSAPNDGL